jgi:hypothetical protein
MKSWLMPPLSDRAFEDLLDRLIYLGRCAANGGVEWWKYHVEYSEVKAQIMDAWRNKVDTIPAGGER